MEDLEDYVMDKRDNETDGLRKEYEVKQFNACYGHWYICIWFSLSVEI